jgi:urease accessory protein
MSLDISPSPLRPSVAQPVLPPRAQGAVALSVQARDGATHLAGLRQSGCLKCILPRVFRPAAEAVLVNTAGGVTGGDRIDIAATLRAGTQLSITTQAAERIYRTMDGTTGRIATKIEVGEGAELYWLPQETILFERARLSRNLHINLATDARLLLCETLVFGRAAMGEQVRDLHLEDRISITREGAPLYRDGIRLSGDATVILGGAAVGAGAGAVATLVFADPEAEALLPKVRALLPETAGASLLNENLLVLRALADDSLSLRRYLIPVLELLSGHSLPAVWRL